MRRTVLIGACSLTLAVTGMAWAQQAAVPVPADNVIVMRKAMMDLQQGVATAMLAAVKSGGDVKPFTDGAKGLVSSSKVIPALFPVGSEKGDETKALPEIWSNRADFEKASANLTTQAEKLVQLADANDKAGFATQFQATGQACGACHRQYRAK